MFRPGVADAEIALGPVEARRNRRRAPAGQREIRHPVQIARVHRVDIAGIETIAAQVVPVVADLDVAHAVRPLVAGKPGIVVVRAARIAECDRVPALLRLDPGQLKTAETPSSSIRW